MLGEGGSPSGTPPGGFSAESGLVLAGSGMSLDSMKNKASGSQPALEGQQLIIAGAGASIDSLKNRAAQTAVPTEAQVAAQGVGAEGTSEVAVDDQPIAAHDMEAAQLLQQFGLINNDEIEATARSGTKALEDYLLQINKEAEEDTGNPINKVKARRIKHYFVRKLIDSDFLPAEVTENLKNNPDALRAFMNDYDVEGLAQLFEDQEFIQQEKTKLEQKLSEQDKSEMEALNDELPKDRPPTEEERAALQEKMDKIISKQDQERLRAKLLGMSAATALLVRDSFAQSNMNTFIDLLFGQLPDGMGGLSHFYGKKEETEGKKPVNAEEFKQWLKQPKEFARKFKQAYHNDKDGEFKKLCGTDSLFQDLLNKMTDEVDQGNNTSFQKVLTIFVTNLFHGTDEEVEKRWKVAAKAIPKEVLNNDNSILDSSVAKLLFSVRNQEHGYSWQELMNG